MATATSVEAGTGKFEVGQLSTDIPVVPDFLSANPEFDIPDVLPINPLAGEVLAKTCEQDLLGECNRARTGMMYALRILREGKLPSSLAVTMLEGAEQALEGLDFDLQKLAGFLGQGIVPQHVAFENPIEIVRTVDFSRRDLLPANFGSLAPEVISEHMQPS